MGRSALAACVILLLLTFTVGATTWYVRPDGTGDLPTIQAAVDTLAPGDTLLLASGVFTGDGNINIAVPAKAFLMMSETADPEDCIIDCEGHLGSPRRGFNFGWVPFGIVINGVTVRNGHADEGGAVSCNGSPTFVNCIFESNRSDYLGGAVSCVYGIDEPVFRNCVFRSNEGSLWGGAIYIEGIWLDVLVDSCEFFDNHASGGGAIYCMMHEAQAEIRNSVFYNNSADGEGGAIWVGSMSTDITRCTFVANAAPIGSAIATGSGEWGASSAWVWKCIIAYNLGGSGYYQWGVLPGYENIVCTDIYGNEGGDWVDGLAGCLGVDGNIYACPSFCLADIEPYDLRLCSGSPCLPGNHPDGYDGGLIGALGQGCLCEPSSTRSTTWGTIKAMYR